MYELEDYYEDSQSRPDAQWEYDDKAFLDDDEFMFEDDPFEDYDDEDVDELTDFYADEEGEDFIEDDRGDWFNYIW